MNITDDGTAYELAIEICGCANDEQRKRDIAAILAYGESHRLRGYSAGLEAAAKVAARTNANFYATGAEAYDTMIAAIRAMIEGETDET